MAAVGAKAYRWRGVEATSDDELLRQWQGGHERSGEQLVERYFDRMYRFFHSKLDAEADEMVQATFLACLAAKDRFRGDSSFRTFLYAIAKNQLYNTLRARQRADQRFELEMSSIADIVSTPRTVIARHQDYEQLVDVMRRLPVAQHTLLELHYWDELGIGELAGIFEVPEVTIRSRLHRARNALRELLLVHADIAASQSLEDMDAWARSLRRGPAS